MYNICITFSLSSLAQKDNLVTTCYIHALTEHDVLWSASAGWLLSDSSPYSRTLFDGFMTPSGFGMLSIHRTQRQEGLLHLYFYNPLYCKLYSIP